MIKKVYRLSELQVKKVLSKRKPFFSYWVVLNTFNNGLNYNRFAIILSWKSVKNSIERNFFRRKFYEIVSKKILENLNWRGNDFVFLVKKETKLDKKDFESIKSFEKDINFLLKIFFSKK